jgi:hypothetical protein
LLRIKPQRISSICLPHRKNLQQKEFLPGLEDLKKLEVQKDSDSSRASSPAGAAAEIERAGTYRTPSPGEKAADNQEKAGAARTPSPSSSQEEAGKVANMLPTAKPEDCESASDTSDDGAEDDNSGDSSSAEAGSSQSLSAEAGSSADGEWTVVDSSKPDYEQFADALEHKQTEPITIFHVHAIENGREQATYLVDKIFRQSQEIPVFSLGREPQDWLDDPRTSLDEDGYYPTKKEGQDVYIEKGIQNYRTARAVAASLGFSYADNADVRAHETVYHAFPKTIDGHLKKYGIVGPGNRTGDRRTTMRGGAVIFRGRKIPGFSPIWFTLRHVGIVCFTHKKLNGLKLQDQAINKIIQGSIFRAVPENIWRFTRIL